MNPIAERDKACIQQVCLCRNKKKINYKSIEIDNKVAWCGECCDCKSQTWVLLFKEGHMLSVILYDFFFFFRK